jgi:hypothetical protein
MAMPTRTNQMTKPIIKEKQMTKPIKAKPETPPPPPQKKKNKVESRPEEIYFLDKYRDKARRVLQTLLMSLA